jgi:hypothetical protein
MREALIEELRQRAQTAEAREQAERERAERCERELSQLRQRQDALIIRLLPPPPTKRGWLGRLFRD